jgi:hypothetical protein
MKKLMEDICYPAVELLHYTHYVAVYLEDNFLAVRTENNAMNICHHISYIYLNYSLAEYHIFGVIIPSLPDRAQVEAVLVDWEDIHDNLVVLHEETERLVH